MCGGGTVRALAAALVVMGALPALAGADCREIGSVPVRITRAGVYCLTRDLAVPAGVEVGIRVEADGVVVDLGGHTLTGRGGAGVRAVGRHGVSVRNGAIRGFGRGVVLEGSGGLHLVEGMRIQARDAGIVLEGRGNTVRRNWLLDGGMVVRGRLARVLENEVRLGGAAAAIRVIDGSGGVVEANQVTGRRGRASVGVVVESGEDVLVLNNRLREVSEGVVLEATQGVTLGNDFQADEVTETGDPDGSL